MATVYKRADRDLQISEATTVRRQVQMELGTSEAIGTVTVRKAGGGTTFGASDGTVTTIYGTISELTIPTADLDTEGMLVYKLQGATDTTYVYGMRVVQHDPFADVAAILDDTGTSGVKLGTGAINTAQFATGALTADAIASNAITAAKLAAEAITPAKLSYYVNDFGGLELQVNETTTARRTIAYRVGTSEVQTVRVSKNGAAFGAAGATATALSGNVFALTIAASDLDTGGTVAFESAGATNTQYITGIKVVSHDLEAINKIDRVTGSGLLVHDSSDGTLKCYDGATTGATLLGTQTRSTSGTQVRWTPS